MERNIDTLPDQLDSRHWNDIARLTWDWWHSEGPAPTFHKYENHRGRALHVDGLPAFTLPKWINRESKEYAAAYVIHEVAHHAASFGAHHGPEYIDIENRMLAAWGMAPLMRRPRGNKYILTLATVAGVPIRPPAGSVAHDNLVYHNARAITARTRRERSRAIGITKRDCTDCYHYPSGKVSHACAYHR